MLENLIMALGITENISWGYFLSVRQSVLYHSFFFFLNFLWGAEVQPQNSHK